MKQLLVAIGHRTPMFVVDTITGEPWEAAYLLVKAIERRGSPERIHFPDPEIGHSLVHALAADELSCLVFDRADDGRRGKVLGGFRAGKGFARGNSGAFERPVSLELAEAMRHFIPDTLYFDIKREYLASLPS
jgi:hypothetical protein